MLELGAGAGILRALGVSYIGLIIVLVGVFLWFPRRGWVKALGVVTVLAIFIGPAYKRSLEREKAEAQSRARYEKAQTLFNKRCEGAGEKIHRVVQGVEGVVWMKWRDKRQASDVSDQYKLFDPYGRDCTEEGCVLNLLRVTQGAEHNPERAQHHSKGYRYVEATPPDSSQPLRYTGVLKLWPHLTRAEAEKRAEGMQQIPKPFNYDFAAESQPIDKLTARYGVTWEDISSREDRDHWIAGSSLKVIDLQTNEVIAERIGYLMDPGQGSEAGFRSPWGMALYAACPSFSKTKGGHPYLSYRTRNFVLQTLQPAED